MHHMLSGIVCNCEEGSMAGMLRVALLVSWVVLSAAEAYGGGDQVQLVRWYAPFLADSGFGSEATAFIEALELTQPNKELNLIQAVQFAEPVAFPSSSPALSRALRQRKSASCTVAICHSTPNFWVPSDFSSWDYVAPCPPKDASVKIGRAMYETDSLPENWVPRLNKMDYIWVPTRFSYDIFSKSGVNKEKLVIVPEPLDVEFYNRARCPSKSDDIFTFLAVFKWEERKGWKELIQAFLQEFGKEEKVRLVIKTTGFHIAKGKTPHLLAEDHFPEMKSREKDILFYQTRVSENELFEKFYCKADAICAPSYGEGWGRVPAEAGSMELPVIYTNFSGTTEFLNSNNAFPITVEKMIPASGMPGHLWALPSVDSLRQRMRYVFTNREAASSIGKKARETMVSLYSLEAVGRYVWDILNHVCPRQTASTKSEL